MTTGIEAGILDALLNHMASYTTTLEVVWPGVSRTPDGNYLDVTVVPNTVEQSSLGSAGFNRHAGLMLVGVLWAKEAGIVDPAEEASSIVAHFKRGTVITRNGVSVRTGPPRTAQALPDGSRMRLPVIIPWSVDTAN